MVFVCMVVSVFIYSNDYGMVKLFEYRMISSSLNKTSSKQIISSHLQYINITDDNKECGIYWLYKNKQLYLNITRVTQTAVIIKNVYSNQCDASRVSIYVSVIGQQSDTEYLGGIAIPHNTKCEWYYLFNITLSGNYTIIARLLYYDGEMQANNLLCKQNE